MGDFSLDLKAVLTIIGIITAITLAIIFQWWRKRKILSYQIISNTSLLTANEEIREKLQILYEGQPVKNVRLFIIKLINNGKQPIDEKDFKKPINFIFSDEARVLSVEKMSVSPDNLEVSLNSENEKISINPTLLNSKDFIEIKAIVSTYEKSLRCDARIVGVKEVRIVKEIPNIFIGISAFFGFVIGLLSPIYLRTSSMIPSYFMLTIIIICFIALIITLIFAFKYSK
jgi:hypothetical protein